MSIFTSRITCPFQPYPSRPCSLQHDYWTGEVGENKNLIGEAHEIGNSSTFLSINVGVSSAPLSLSRLKT